MSELRPTARRRELGVELRRVRRAAGLSLSALCRQLDWSPSKMSRIENGKLSCTEIEAAIFLSYCRLPVAEVNEILTLCAKDQGESWLQENGGLPDQLRTLILHETTASVIYELELDRVPGLLQTESYARALMQAGRVLLDTVIESRVRIRMERQKLFRRDDSPQCIFYIHEQALRLPVGGSGVMHDQMLHLVFMSAKSQCKIRIIPSAAGAYPGMSGPFRLMQYDEHSPLVSVETQNHSLFLESATDIATYRLLLGALADVALSVEQSRSVLAQVASEYDRAEASGHDLRDRLA